MWHQISANKRKSVIVLFLLTLLLSLFGASLGFYLFETIDGAIGGTIFIIAVFIFMINIAKRNAMDTMLGDKVYLYQKELNPKLYNIVEEMTLASGLSKVPDIYLMDTDIPNAFACGVSPEYSSICVTKGLLEILDRDELQGVIAHEIAHIVNRDTTYLLYAGVIVTLITAIAKSFSRSRGRRRSSRGSSGNAIVLIIVLSLIILAPIIAQFFYMSLSRKREYLADASAAQFTRYPEGLARALEKISTEGKNISIDEDNNIQKDPFLRASCIVPSLEKDGLFSTHPNTINRIKILLSMTGADYNAYNCAYYKITNKRNVIHRDDVKKCKQTEILNPATTLGLVSATEEITPEAKLKTKVENRRESEDLMWKHAGYIFVECSCGTILKLPPSYKNSEINCPHCKTKHTI